VPVSPNRPPARGTFVTIEGPDGAGKTSQAERLREHAVSCGLDVVLTREPGGTPAGERIRELLLAPDEATEHDPRMDALLFNAARAHLVREVIEPALDRGALVISTRFADSTAAYQGHGAGLPVDELRAVERFATGGLRPELTIVLDLPVEVGLARKGGEETRFETEFDIAFHRRVRAGFLAMAAADADRFRIVDATGDPDTVFEAVLANVAGLPGLDLMAGGTPSTEPPGLPARIHR
jgi:dTMP kinase